MKEVRVLEIKESVFADNDRQADNLRRELKEQGVFLMNLMSSPGSGKTTTLKGTIERLKGQLRIGVMEADIDSDVDAKAIAGTGVKAIQLHTGGMCHLDAEMTRQGIEGLGVEDVDLAILEANHDVEALRSGPYPYYLKQRILGTEGHLCNEDAAQFAVTLAENGASDIVLAHLSRDNNTPTMALNAVAAALDGAGLAPELSVAPRDTVGPCHIVRRRAVCKR